VVFISVIGSQVHVLLWSLSQLLVVRFMSYCGVYLSYW
jgi:hypothetical protein